MLHVFYTLPLQSRHESTKLNQPTSILWISLPLPLILRWTFSYFTCVKILSHETYISSAVQNKLLNSSYFFNGWISNLKQYDVCQLYDLCRKNCTAELFICIKLFSVAYVVVSFEHTHGTHENTQSTRGALENQLGCCVSTYATAMWTE